MMKDKDVESAVNRLFPLFDDVIVTLADPDRGTEPAVLEGHARRLGIPCSTRRNPRDAVRLAVRRRNRALVCGSLYVAGAAIPILDREQTKSR